MADALAAEWAQLVAELDWPGAAAGGLRDELLDAYREGHRRYHGVAHLEAVLATLAELTAPQSPSAAARLAAWFHDAVYDPARGDNEERSAALARDRLAAVGADAALIDDVTGLVLATKAHEVPPSVGAPDHGELLDADMAILAGPPERYRAYAAAIRAEYGHLDDEAFRRGRAAVLRSFLARPAIFASRAGAERFEAAARANLRAELAELGEGAGGADDGPRVS